MTAILVLQKIRKKFKSLKLNISRIVTTNLRQTYCDNKLEKNLFTFEKLKFGEKQMLGQKNETKKFT